MAQILLSVADMPREGLLAKKAASDCDRLERSTQLFCMYDKLPLTSLRGTSWGRRQEAEGGSNIHQERKRHINQQCAN